MANNNIFNTQRCDLGTSSTTQVTKGDVDQAFKHYATVSNQCIFCTNTSSYKIIPKDPNDLTAEIEDKGFICEHCVKQGFLDKERYGIRPLK